MIRLLVRILLQFISSAVGLFLASLVVPGFHIEAVGFLVSLLFFVGIGFLVEPLLFKLSLQYLPALRGGIAFVTTFVSLLLTTIFTNALAIDDLTTWIIAPLIIWLCILLASVILPLFMFKKILQDKSSNNN